MKASVVSEVMSLSFEAMLQKRRKIVAKNNNQNKNFLLAKNQLSIEVRV
jgi:hypothetical protein